MKKVIIVGGGIAGLTAGILLQKTGLQVEIYEKNRVLGGECTGWKRQGYIIDNCIHWMTGAKEGSKINKVWQEIGALGNGIELRKKDMFYSSSLNGQTLTFYRDIERTRQDMLALSPQDKKEINKLCKLVKISQDITVPVDKPYDKMNIIELTKLGLHMKNGLKVMQAYKNMNIEDLANTFVHPLIRQAIIDYMPGNYQAYAFVVSYATVTSGDGDVPAGGSMEMIRRIENKFESLGGRTFVSTPVKNILLNNNKATGVVLENGNEVTADYVICACDSHYVFNKLLPSKFMPKGLRKEYNNRKKYPVRSSLQMAFGIDGQFKELTGNQFFSCKPINVAERKLERLNIYCYDYEPNYAPKDKSIIQTTIVQNENDFEYWKKLFEDKDVYEKEKNKLSNEFVEGIVEKYPFLKGKIKVLDVWTPITYVAYCNAYKGSYMSFTATKKVSSIIVPGTIKGVKNVFIASQWQMSPGGLPTALAMGKFAAWRILNKEKKI